MTADLRPYFVDAIKSAHRIKSGEPIILLFGGSIGSSKKKYLSLRDAVYKTTAIKNPQLYNKLRLVENFKDWANYDLYTDLTTFEKHLAAASCLIILISESAGSIAELGVFSQHPEISKKIKIIIPSTHSNKDSFIYHGIIRQIASENISHTSSEKIESQIKNIKQSYYWKLTNKNIKIDPETIGIVLSKIDSHIEEITNEPSIESDITRSILTTIYDLIKTLHALKESEIYNYIENIYPDKSTKKLIKQYIYMLERLKIIKSQEYNGSEYYLSGNHTYHEIQLPKEINRSRLSLEILEYYKNNKEHKHRVKAIEASRKNP